MSLLEPTLAEPVTPDEFQRQAAERVTPSGKYLAAELLGGLEATRPVEAYGLASLPSRFAPDEYGLMPAGPPPPDLLSKEQFDGSVYKRPGLEWEQGETEARAAARAAVHDRQAYLDSLVQRSDAGWLGQLGGFGLRLGAAAFDPTNYIPLIGPASKAAMVARFGRVGGALLGHGADAALNTGLFEPLAATTAQAQGRGYGWEEAGSDILANALGGAVLGTAVGEAARVLGFGHATPDLGAPLPKIPPEIPHGIPPIPHGIPPEPVAPSGEISGGIPRSQEIPRTPPTIPGAPGAGADLTPAEEEALRSYKDLGYLNQRFRAEGKLAPADGPKAAAQAATLDSALAKSRVEQATTVYRGIATGEKTGDPAALVGKELPASNFQSATTDRELALEYAGRDQAGGGGVLLEVDVPAGSRGAWLDRYAKEGRPAENELLLPRDGAFRVTAARREGNVTVLTGEWLDPKARGLPAPAEVGAGVVPRRPGQPPLRVDDLMRRADAASLALDQADRGEPVDVGRVLANDPALRAPSQTGLDAMRPGAGIVGGMYNMLHERYSRGETTEAGAPSVFLQVAKAIDDRGRTLTRDEFPALAADVMAARKAGSGPEIQAAMRGIIDKWAGSPEGAARVGDEVARQLAAAGVPEAEARPQAALWQAFFDTMGRRAGIDPGALFDRYRVGVERGGTAEPGALFQAHSTRLRMGVDRLVKAAEEQSSWRGWYEQHGETLKNIFGDDAPLFQKMLSATSQAASVKSNVGLALKAYRQLKTGEPFTGYLPAVIKNLERVKADEVLAGAKIAQYGKANEGDTGAIAVDRHIAMLLFDTRSPSGPQIRKAQETIRAVSAKLGWEPRQVQAALWAYNQVRLGTDPAKVESYDKILERRADEIAALRSAFPDAGGEGTGVPGRRDLAPGTGAGEALYQSGAAGPRGSIAFAGDGRTVIRLFQSADASTFLHESGHLFARVMRELAERDGAPEGVARDWRTLRDWLGLKKGEDLGVEHEEKLARGFEAYLRDGEAPSSALKSVFETIKGWLRQVYETLSELGVTPSPEVRAVFDRMLGGEEDVARPHSLATAAPEPPHPSAAEAAKRVGKDTPELETFAKDARLEGYDKPLPKPEGASAPERGVAITAAGRHVPVAYEVVEARDLIASHDDDMRPDPSFPAELQPRDRTRAASGAQVAAMAGSLEPALLGRSATASDGAPIVGPDGVVESGNARVLAIRKAYRDGLPGGAAYRQELARQGYDVAGMEAPVLVRRRTGEMAPADRAAFAREANVSGVAAMGAAERAAADAAALKPAHLELLTSGDMHAAGNRPFVRAFLGALPEAERAGLLTADGELSKSGGERLRNAVLAKAFGDPGLVARLAEEPETGLGGLGRALADVAPEWAKMRAEAAAGRIAPEGDGTPALLEALHAIIAAKAAGNPPHFALSQGDLLGGGLSADGAAFLRSFLTLDKRGGSRVLGRDKLAAALDRYVTEARKQQPGVDMFGVGPAAPAGIIEGREAARTPAEKAAALAALPPELGEVEAMRREGTLTPADEAALAAGEAEATRAESYADAWQTLVACVVRNA